LPFTYLGLPLGHSKPSNVDCLPLSIKVPWGKLQLVKSVLSSPPTFYMCSIKMPMDILNKIDKYKRHCLGMGADVNATKRPIAGWKLVTKLKLKGGLGVIKLRLQNDILLMKILHKFFNMMDLPWVKLLWSKYYRNGKVPGQSPKGSFWWRSILKLLNTFKGIA
jgi:hypothetical protein